MTSLFPANMTWHVSVLYSFGGRTSNKALKMNTNKCKMYPCSPTNEAAREDSFNF